MPPGASPPGRPTPHPLCWPAGRPRTPRSRRRRTPFSESGTPVSLAVATGRVRSQLDKLATRNLVLSSNAPAAPTLTRPDSKQPEDPGVAVYFDLEGAPHCVCCDTWDRVADNLAAVAKHLEAVQGQLRWGVADLAQMLVGFRIAPLPRERPPWWEVLGFRDRPALLELIRLQRRALAARYHPDRGGSGARMAEINEAYQEGVRELGGEPEADPGR